MLKPFDIELTRACLRCLDEHTQNYPYHYVSIQDEKLDKFRLLINTTFKCGHILELSAHTTIFACYLLHRCWSANEDYVRKNL